MRRVDFSATTSIHQSTTLPAFSPVLTMAIARPIRMLGAACIILCFFIVFQIRKSPAALTLGGSKMRDPLLDRTLCDPILIWPSFAFGSATLRDTTWLTWTSNRRTRRSLMASRRQRLLPRQQQFRAHQCGAHLPCSKRRAERADPDYAESGEHMEPQVQLPVVLLQRQAVHGGIQAAD